MVGTDSATAAGERVGRKGILSRIGNLKVGARIYLGFGIAFALVLALALVGTVALYGMSRGVGAFSASADVARMAADVDIGMRDLQVAVRDYQTDASDAALAVVTQRRDALAGSVRALERAAETPVDHTAAAEAAASLARYAEGFEELMALRQERSQLLVSVLDPLVVQTRDRLTKLKDSGGVDSATLASEAAIAVLMVKDHAVRLIDRRDPRDAQAMREELESATNRLAELNRYLWVPGTRQMINDVESMLGSLGGILDRLEEVLAEEEKVRGETLLPAAATLAARAAEIRQHNETLAERLRTALAGESAGLLKLALWLGGAVLLVGLLAGWLVARSVARPVDGMARAVTALAQGDPAAGGLPALSPRALAREDEIGAMARAVATLRTTSEEAERQRRQAETAHAELASAKERAEADTVAKTHFLVNMGHELHGPLTAIIDNAQSLMGALYRHGAGELAAEVEMIQWSGEQLVGLVDSILDYAKIEAGTMDLCLQDFDVGRLLVECRERSLPNADLNGNSLALSSPPAGLGAMHSDFTKVRQALLNLLDNAAKFTRSGDITLSAQRIERDGRAWLRFTVTDTGIGFAPSQTRRLFQPFVQGSGLSGGGKVQGAGLGLTLVGHYCAILHGDIEVASEPGQGTRITLSLPAVHRSDEGAAPARVKTVDGVLSIADERTLPGAVS